MGFIKIIYCKLHVYVLQSDKPDLPHFIYLKVNHGKIKVLLFTVSCACKTYDIPDPVQNCDL